jgi:hypothetical protein
MVGMQQYPNTVFDFELKRISKIILFELILVLVPKTEPRMIAPMNRIVNAQIGMANLFFRYQ